MEDGPGLADVTAMDGVCQVQPFAKGPSLVLYPDGYDRVYFPVQLNDCSACASPRHLQLNSILLNFRTNAACTFQVDVSVVGASGTTCLAPNDADVICPPTAVDVTSPGTAAFEATLPLPPGFCIGRDAFICVQFTSYDGCLDVGAFQGPPIRTTPAIGCVPCTNYFTSKVDVPNVTDWCATGTSYNLWWALDADCCNPTSTHEHSWGRMKQIYR